MALAILNIGPFELLLMAAAAIMLFGGDLPKAARQTARVVGRVRSLAAELGREFSAPSEVPNPRNFQLNKLIEKVALDDDAPPKSLPGDTREDEQAEPAQADPPNSDV
jgi:Sec-independent protein translocase protein TatA